jgi:iron complex outermembrane receptor protein
LLINEQGGEFANWGADLAVEARLAPSLLLSASYSWLDRNVVTMAQVGEQVLSVPRNKASLSLSYGEIRRGLDGLLQGRWVESFPVNSGVYAGQIGTYVVIDLGLGWRLYWSPEVRLSVEAQNILDHRHQEWIGAPELGRLVMVRGQVNF